MSDSLATPSKTQDAPSAQQEEEGLPVHKLQCHLPGCKPVVLLACGSYNPPTILHMRMFDLAADALTEAGIDVWGGYLSPVNNGYGKAGLAPGPDRLRMCEAAASDHPFVMCDPWEVQQGQYTRTLTVLRRLQAQLQNWWDRGGRPSQPPTLPSQPFSTGLSQTSVSHTAATAAAGAGAAGATYSRGAEAAQTTPPHPATLCDLAGPPHVMLLCGEDVLLSMTIPGVWEEPERLLQEFPAVCIERPQAGGPSTAVRSLHESMQQQDSVLHRCSRHIHVVRDVVHTTISSTAVRQQLALSRSVRYLVPDAVLRYLKQNPSLYRR